MSLVQLTSHTLFCLFLRLPSPLSDEFNNESEVVNTGELIFTNFIDGGVTDYKKVSHTVLIALDPSTTDSDVILA